MDRAPMSPAAGAGLSGLAPRTEVRRGGHEQQVWIGGFAAFLRTWQPR